MKGGEIMRFKFLLLFAVLLFACQHKMPTEPGKGFKEPQWAMYGGNVRHTGNVNTPAYDGIVGPTDSNTVSVKWVVNIDDLIGWGNVQSQPVSDKDGTVYITTTGGLVALDLDGNLKWHFAEYGNAPVTIGDDGTVYYHGISGNLHALDRHGNVKWKTLTFKSGDPHVFFQTTWMNLVVLKNNIVAVTGLDSLQPTIIALNGKDGSIIWEKKFGEKSSFMSIEAVADDGTLYIYQGSPNARLFAIKPGGHILWSVPEPWAGGAANFHRVIDAEGTIYDYPDILSPTGQDKGPNFLPPFGALWYDRYFATFGLHDTLGCYSISDGNVLWRAKPENVEFLSLPTVDAAGNMYVLGSGGPAAETIPGFLIVYGRDGHLILQQEIDSPRLKGYIFDVRYEPVLVSDGSVVVVGDESPFVAALRREIVSDRSKSRIEN